MPHHIAIVEDEPTIAANYRDALQRQGFTVTLHANRAAANRAFELTLPDLAIIDVGLGQGGVLGTGDSIRTVSPSFIWRSCANSADISTYA